MVLSLDFVRKSELELNLLVYFGFFSKLYENRAGFTIMAQGFLAIKIKL